MAAPPFHVLSENPDGTPFLIVGAGLSPANADIVFTSRDSAGSYGPLPEYVAKSLGITVSDIWAEGKPGDFGVARPFGRIIAHLTSVDGVSDTPTLMTQNMRHLLRGPLADDIANGKDLTVWIPLMGSGAGGLPSASAANLIGLVLAEFLADPAYDTSGIRQITISSGLDITEDDFDAVLDALRSYRILPDTDAPASDVPPPEPARSAPRDTDPIDENPPEPDPPLAQNADFRSDRPVTDLADDALDRAVVARAIFEKVRAFWAEDGGPPPRYPFMVHIAGRWGSGKSTILNFLGQILREDETLAPPRTGRTRETRKNWVVVTFNAWQHQAQRPVWWSLLNAVADQAALQMAPQQSRWFNNRNRFFRFRIDRGIEYTFAGIAVFLLVLGVLWYSNLNGAPPAPDPAKAPEATDVPGLILKIAALLTAVGTIGTALQKFFQRTQDTADALVALDDTTAPLKRRFEEMIREIHRPVAIFIDDLDRCDADYVIELLQAIQTIYVDVPVLYVVAADRDWIVSAYDQTYKGFKSDIDQPGQPLGYLFVKKIFQLSVNVPDLDSEYGRSFLLAQLRDTPEDKIDQAEADRIRAQVQAAPSLEATQIIIESQPTQTAKRIAGSEGFLKYLTPETQEEIEHLLVRKLTQPEMLLDPNPRAIKRLVNAYSFRSGFALSAGQTQVIPKLPYWCVLDLRYPYSAERLAAFPELAKGDAWMTDGMTLKDDGTWTGVNRHFPVQDHSEIRKIVANLSADDIRELRLYG